MQHGMVHGKKDLHYKLQVLQLQILGIKLKKVVEINAYS